MANVLYGHRVTKFSVTHGFLFFPPSPLCHFNYSLQISTRRLSTNAELSSPLQVAALVVCMCSASTTRQPVHAATVDESARNVYRETPMSQKIYFTYTLTRCTQTIIRV